MAEERAGPARCSGTRPLGPQPEPSRTRCAAPPSTSRGAATPRAAWGGEQGARGRWWVAAGVPRPATDHPILSATPRTTRMTRTTRTRTRTTTTRRAAAVPPRPRGIPPTPTPTDPARLLVTSFGFSVLVPDLPHASAKALPPPPAPAGCSPPGTPRPGSGAAGTLGRAHTTGGSRGLLCPWAGGEEGAPPSLPPPLYCPLTEGGEVIYFF